MPVSKPVISEVAGRTLKVTNLDKVLYPSVGFTKASVIEYYVTIGQTMLTHIANRGITFKRWPDGVDAEAFFNKRAPSHRPDWVGTCRGPGDKGKGIDYPVLNEVASLAWAANLAALEIHSPMSRCDDIDSPTILVFDLDPGEPATIIECARIALDIRSILGAVGLECFAKTSGSKGMQVYSPLNSPHTHRHAQEFALAVAQLLEKKQPESVTSVMAKAKRPGKVFIDWSQNSRHKTTIAPYSLRGRALPTVSTPVSWDEVADCADGEMLSFDAANVIARVGLFGDIFEPVATLEQALPLAKTSST